MLSAQPGGLEIQVRDRETKKHTRLEERSAGLRSFVALIAFCATHAGGRTPILLIDEAENHLHYEGQANLLKVFEPIRCSERDLYDAFDRMPSRGPGYVYSSRCSYV
jgi:predicted ATPase